MPKFELWTSPEGDTTFLEPGPDAPAEWLVGKNAKVAWSIEADTWCEASIQYHEYMGWSPYNPMEDCDCAYCIRRLL